MPDISSLGDFAAYACLHAGSSKLVVTKSMIARLYGDKLTDKEVQRKRALLSAAIALGILGRRWGNANKLLAVFALVCGLLDLVPHSEEYAYARSLLVSTSFFPAASAMWVKWPAAAAGKTSVVHPEFTGTMAKLQGFMRKSEVVAYGANTAMTNSWTLSQFAQRNWQGTKWGFKSLATVYVLQALMKWAWRRKADAKDLVRRLREALENTLRTQFVYQVCASYSTWAFGHYGTELAHHHAWPVAVFLLEPLSRFRTMTLYYVSHFLFATYQETRQTLMRSGSAPAVATASHAHGFLTSLGLPALFVLYAGAATDSNPPFMSLLQKLTV